MRVVNLFHLGTGSESNDSLESLTKTLYDSAIGIGSAWRNVVPAKTFKSLAAFHKEGRHLGHCHL